MAPGATKDRGNTDFSSAHIGIGVFISMLSSFWHILCCTCLCASIGGVAASSATRDSSTQVAIACLVPVVGCCLWSLVLLPGMPCYIGKNNNCVGSGIDDPYAKDCECFLSKVSLVGKRGTFKWIK